MEKKSSNTKSSLFTGCTIVVTGKLENFTRNAINDKISSIGATARGSVSKRTDYRGTACSSLYVGEKPGSKLEKARELGIPILTEKEFLDRIST